MMPQKITSTYYHSKTNLNILNNKCQFEIIVSAKVSPTIVYCLTPLNKK